MTKQRKKFLFFAVMTAVACASLEYKLLVGQLDALDRAFLAVILLVLMAHSIAASYLEVLRDELKQLERNHDDFLKDMERRTQDLDQKADEIIKKLKQLRS